MGKTIIFRTADLERLGFQIGFAHSADEAIRNEAARNARLYSEAENMLSALIAIREADPDGIAHIDIQSIISRIEEARP